MFKAPHSAAYLIYRKFIRIPLFNSHLRLVDDMDPNVRALPGYDTAGGAAHIACTNAAHVLHHHPSPAEGIKHKAHLTLSTTLWTLPLPHARSHGEATHLLLTCNSWACNVQGLLLYIVIKISIHTDTFSQMMLHYTWRFPSLPHLQIHLSLRTILGIAQDSKLNCLIRFGYEMPAMIQGQDWGMAVSSSGTPVQGTWQQAQLCCSS